MDIPLFFFAIFVPLLLLILMRSTSSTKLPPGPFKLPIIGNIHQLFGYVPHQRLRDLANKYGPIMHLQLGQIPFVVISSPELAKEVMKTHDLVFATRPPSLAARIIAYDAKNIASAPYGEYWRQIKKIFVSEVLSPKRVQSFRSVREEEVSNLIRTITSSVGAPVNIKKMIMGLLYCIVTRTAFGKIMREKDATTPLIQKTVNVFGGFSIPDLFPSIKLLETISGARPKLLKVHKEVDAMVEEVIQEHRERKKKNNETEDFVDVLLNLQDHGNLDVPLTTDAVKGIIMEMLFGGVEAASTAIEWIMSEIVKNPEVMRRAQEEVRRVYNGKEKVDETYVQDLTYLKAIVKEGLRLHPPTALLIPREAMQGVELCGFKIPEKTQVLINVWATGRDPRHWNEPEKFNPERFLNSDIDYKGTHFEYTPFGGGRRMCPGSLYAISVAHLVLVNLLYHFNWTIPNGIKPEELDMTEGSETVTSRKNELCLIFTLYAQSSS